MDIFTLLVEPYKISHVTTYTICVLCFDDDSLAAGAIKSVEDCFDFEIKGFNNPPEFQYELSLI